MQTNISPPDVFRLLGQPIRVQIILIIATGEACVCHMEAILGVRQATISQHLMVLRDSGLVTAKRIGRNIFYSLVNPALYEAVIHLSIAAGSSEDELKMYATSPIKGCPCPLCNPGIDPALSCTKVHKTSI
jgi:ArsR family transcriptional regulator